MNGELEDVLGRKEHTVRRLISIDALRGVASLAVTYFHGTTTSAFVISGQLVSLFTIPTLILSYGYIGVFLFFVISGFCIHLRWAKEKSRGHDPSVQFIPFWKRRVRRLYPAYLIALFVYIAVLALEGKINSLGFAFYDLFMHLFMLHNLDNRTCLSINGVFWTLAIEEQLYLAYFLLLYLRKRLPWLWTLSICLAARLVWFGLCLVLHRAFAIDMPAAESAASNWFPWALGALSVEAMYGIIKLPRWCRSLYLGGAFLLVAASLAYADRLANPRGLFHDIVWLVNLPIWSVAFFLIINAVTYAEKGWNNNRTPRLLSWAAAVGVFSYSLYLTHELVLVYFGDFINQLLGISGNFRIILSWLFLCPLSVVFARVYFEFFEKPFLPSSQRYIENKNEKGLIVMTSS